jgi:hypothetical protein
MRHRNETCDDAGGTRRPDELTMRTTDRAIEPVRRPSLALLGAEPFRAALELASHKFARPAPSTPGDGHAVVLFPGLGADGASVSTLRAHCRALGYDAFDWGQGVNTGPQGDLDAWLHRLSSQVIDLLADRTQPATLIGWSLGGLFRLLSGSSPTMDAALSRRLRTPPPLRTTSIYSRSDGVVAWQTCRHDERSRLVHDIEVDGSHIGMGWNRDVLAAVTDRLGARPGPWRRYVRAQ